MKKKKWEHAKTKGNKTESIAKDWLSKYNCKQEDTMRNTRRNAKYFVNGEYLCMAEIAEKYNISYYVIRSRIRLGWSIDELIQPVGYRRKKVNHE